MNETERDVAGLKGVVVSKGTIHTTTDWKTDGKYGLYRRTAANDKGEGAGFEVLLEPDKEVIMKYLRMEDIEKWEIHALESGHPTAEYEQIPEGIICKGKDCDWSSQGG